jgi:DNA-binding protein H-NS
LSAEIGPHWSVFLDHGLEGVGHGNAGLRFKGPLRASFYNPAGRSVPAKITETAFRFTEYEGAPYKQRPQLGRWEMAKKLQKVAAKHAVKSPQKKAPARVPVDIDRLLSSLEHLTTPQLRKLIEHASAVLDTKSEGDRRSFIEEVTSRAKDMGMSVADLFSNALPASMRPKPQGKGKKPGGVAVKFRSPNGETWSGRGRPPRWLSALEAAGKSRSDFAV